MIIRRYRNGVLVSEEVSKSPPPATLPSLPKAPPPPTQSPIPGQPAPSQPPPSPKKGCGCGSKKKP